MMFKALYYDGHMKTEMVKSVQATIDSPLIKLRLDMMLEELEGSKPQNSVGQ